VSNFVNLTPDALYWMYRYYNQIRWSFSRNNTPALFNGKTSYSTVRSHTTGWHRQGLDITGPHLYYLSEQNFIWPAPITLQFMPLHRRKFARFGRQLTLILLTWRIWWVSINASKWQMGFNLAFKGLKATLSFNFKHPLLYESYAFL